MSDHVPAEEKQVVEQIEADLLAAGIQLGLSKEGDDVWAAALIPLDRDYGAAPFAIGGSAEEATRAAWRLYLSTPSLNSMHQHMRDRESAES